MDGRTDKNLQHYFGVSSLFLYSFFLPFFNILLQTCISLLLFCCRISFFFLSLFSLSIFMMMMIMITSLRLSNFFKFFSSYTFIDGWVYWTFFPLSFINLTSIPIHYSNNPLLFSPLVLFLSRLFLRYVNYLFFFFGPLPPSPYLND